MMEWLKLELEVLTPAFISGADQNQLELRSASVRGLLRWWWRAAVGHQYDNPAKLAEPEARLFGSATHKLKSPLRVTVRCNGLPQWATNRERLTAEQVGILRYIGYGAFFRPGESPRPALAPGSKFTVTLAWPHGVLTNEQQDDLVHAACAWVTLGGIGSRSRKGFGQLDGKIAAASSEFRQRASQVWASYRQDLLRNGRAVDSEIPPFPQLEYRRIWKSSQTYSKWQDALGSIGKCYKEHRPSGDKRWIAGEADPRRASSLLISVIRENIQHEGTNTPSAYRPLLCLLPCINRPTTPDEEAISDFIGTFQALTCS
jgi:CRISPR type III-B/RAMP module RAMP protein Cmr1